MIDSLGDFGINGANGGWGGLGRNWCTLVALPFHEAAEKVYLLSAVTLSYHACLVVLVATGVAG